MTTWRVATPQDLSSPALAWFFVLTRMIGRRFPESAPGFVVFLLERR